MKAMFRRLYREKLISEYGESYFQDLLGEYQTLCLKDADPEIKRVAEEIIQRESPTWSDIFTFETIILKLQPVEMLRRRAWNLRAKYHSMVGQHIYDVYLKSNPPDPNNASEADLRGDLEQLLNEFHWQYTVTLAREKMRASISKWVVGLLGLIVVLIAIITGILIYFESPVEPPTFLIVLFMGVLGGFVSTQFRLQGNPGNGEPIEDLTKLDRGWLSIFLSPISGAIFAVILYMMFTGGYLQGDLFPHIVTPSQEGNKEMAFEAFTSGTGPAAGADFAKLIIWSFIAGFAERFVPDTLDRIIASRQNSK